MVAALAFHIAINTSGLANDFLPFGAPLIAVFSIGMSFGQKVRWPEIVAFFCGALLISTVSLFAYWLFPERLKYPWAGPLSVMSMFPLFLLLAAFHMYRSGKQTENK